MLVGSERALVQLGSQLRGAGRLAARRGQRETRVLLVVAPVARVLLLRVARQRALVTRVHGARTARRLRAGARLMVGSQVAALLLVMRRLVLKLRLVVVVVWVGVRELQLVLAHRVVRRLVRVGVLVRLLVLAQVGEALLGGQLARRVVVLGRVILLLVRVELARRLGRRVMKARGRGVGARVAGVRGRPIMVVVVVAELVRVVHGAGGGRAERVMVVQRGGRL